MLKAGAPTDIALTEAPAEGGAPGLARGSL